MTTVDEVLNRVVSFDCELCHQTKQGQSHEFVCIVVHVTETSVRGGLVCAECHVNGPGQLHAYGNTKAEIPE